MAQFGGVNSHEENEINVQIVFAFICLTKRDQRLSEKLMDE